jgi:Ca2+/Na+ antiporter
MKLTHTMIVMFIGSFIIQYFLMPPIMVNSIEDITNNIGKAYSAIIMALSMVILEIMMHDHQYEVISYNLYAILFSLILLFIYLYRKQIAINDKQYLDGMIEHHSMALFASDEILKKTNDYNIAKLAKNIIQTQNDEIRDMREFLKKMA